MPKPSADSRPDPNIIALGIRQPWAELILRGVKTIEVRSQNTQVRGTIYIYAAKKVSDFPAALDAAREHGIDVDELPRGVIVGSVTIERTAPSVATDASFACVPAGFLTSQFSWTLSRPHRFDPPLAVRFLPYGIWFYPFKRRS